MTKLNSQKELKTLVEITMEFVKKRCSQCYDKLL